MKINSPRGGKPFLRKQLKTLSISTTGWVGATWNMGGSQLSGKPACIPIISTTQNLLPSGSSADRGRHDSDWDLTGVGARVRPRSRGSSDWSQPGGRHSAVAVERSDRRGSPSRAERQRLFHPGGRPASPQATRGVRHADVNASLQTGWCCTRRASGAPAHTTATAAVSG